MGYYFFIDDSDILYQSEFKSDIKAIKYRDEHMTDCVVAVRIDELKDLN
jgi:hypothetical protein